MFALNCKLTYFIFIEYILKLVLKQFYARTIIVLKTIVIDRVMMDCDRRYK